MRRIKDVMDAMRNINDQDKSAYRHKAVLSSGRQKSFQLYKAVSSNTDNKLMSDPEKTI